MYQVQLNVWQILNENERHIQVCITVVLISESH